MSPLGSCHDGLRQSEKEADRFPSLWAGRKASAWHYRQAGSKEWSPGCKGLTLWLMTPCLVLIPHLKKQCPLITEARRRSNSGHRTFFCCTPPPGWLGPKATSGLLILGGCNVGWLVSWHTDRCPGKQRNACVGRVGLIMVFRYKRPETNHFIAPTQLEVALGFVYMCVI